MRTNIHTSDQFSVRELSIYFSHSSNHPPSLLLSPPPLPLFFSLPLPVGHEIEALPCLWRGEGDLHPFHAEGGGGRARNGPVKVWLQGKGQGEGGKDGARKGGNVVVRAEAVRGGWRKEGERKETDGVAGRGPRPTIGKKLTRSLSSF